MSKTTVPEPLCVFTSNISTFLMFQGNVYRGKDFLFMYQKLLFHCGYSKIHMLTHRNESVALEELTRLYSRLGIESTLVNIHTLVISF